MKESNCGILIVGGGTGGCAAAMAATDLGCTVIMTEETDWIGGQLTAQAVPPDEHPWIESFGCTRRCRRFRDAVRQYYRDYYPLTARARADGHLNPGKGNVSRICHEPRAALAVLNNELARAQSAARLEMRLRRRPVEVFTEGDSIRAVRLLNMETGADEIVHARYVLDATETGELLALGGVEYVTGAESQSQTGEPHAVSGEPQPRNMQAVTWCFAMGYDPSGAHHVIDKPAQYDRWRAFRPDFWPGPLIGWDALQPHTLAPVRYHLLPGDGPLEHSMFAYRRIICRDHFAAGTMPEEVTIVNWVLNDYFAGNIIDEPAELARERLGEARQLSLSLMYWLQTEAPRVGGGAGYPCLRPRPDITGTADGLAKSVYIRESRRIQAVFTVTENHIGSGCHPGVVKAEPFFDSVGIGCYRIDLHPSTGGDNYIDVGALPFEIPLGALLPVRTRNLLPACKNIGTTHISNGCYRLHPVEWNIGEAAGALAAFCVARECEPSAVREREPLLNKFQSLLVQQGFELRWPELKAL
ncbi:MAG: FAD-dependent oxidoreductase [bacterium]|nr:FAD-dependent oxidoreductase [Candidatus Sumerlaeota bacterium]